jgi:hypothetical protein
VPRAEAASRIAKAATAMVVARMADASAVPPEEALTRYGATFVGVASLVVARSEEEEAEASSEEEEEAEASSEEAAGAPEASSAPRAKAEWSGPALPFLN